MMSEIFSLHQSILANHSDPRNETMLIIVIVIMMRSESLSKVRQLAVTLYFPSSLEIVCQWKPINLDHRNKSISPVSDHDGPTIASEIRPVSPIRPQLESQIRVQTPPSSKVVANHVSN